MHLFLQSEMGILDFFRRQKDNDNEMKYLIAGLGNMGAEYDGTRHNVGFSVLDKITSDADITYKHETLGDIAIVKHKGRSFHLLKPSTFMNLSGKAIRYWMNKLSIPQDRILVITDDLNIPFGSIRIRPNGSDGGHNGLKNINEVLGNQGYARIRIGISADFSRGRQVDYVLGRWSREESEKLPEILQHAAKAAFAFGIIGITETMNQYTRK